MAQQIISLSIDSEVIARLDKLVERRETNRSKLVERMLIASLPEYEEAMGKLESSTFERKMAEFLSGDSPIAMAFTNLLFHGKNPEECRKRLKGAVAAANKTAAEKKTQSKPSRKSDTPPAKITDPIT